MNLVRKQQRTIKKLLHKLKCCCNGGGNTASILKTGVTASITDGDDGQNERGRLKNHFELEEENLFGNTQRFTGVKGGYYDQVLAGYKNVNGGATSEAIAFPDTLIIDWATYNAEDNTVFVFDYTPVPGASNLAKLNGGSYSKGGVDTFEICNIKELDHYFNYGTPFGLSWLPIDHTLDGSVALRVTSSTPFGAALVSLINNIQRNTQTTAANNTMFMGAYFNVNDDLNI